MYAVAGVTGQTGAAVARALLDAGEQVRVIVRRAEAGNDWKARGAEVAVADMADAPALTAALRGTAGAYLLNPPRYAAADPFALATEAGAAFARAIDASGIPRAVVLSAVGAHLPQGTGIIVSNHRVEQELATARTPVASLRAQYFFENWSHVLGAVHANGVLPSFLGPADKRFPMVTVADIAAEVAALLRGGPWVGRRIVGLASFEATPAEVAQAFSTALGKPVAPVIVPREQWAGILAGNGFSPAVVEAFVGMYDGINSGVVAQEPGQPEARGNGRLEAAVATLLRG